MLLQLTSENILNICFNFYSVLGYDSFVFLAYLDDMDGMACMLLLVANGVIRTTVMLPCDLTWRRISSFFFQVLGFFRLISFAKVLYFSYYIVMK